MLNNPAGPRGPAYKEIPMIAPNYELSQKDMDYIAYKRWDVSDELMSHALGMGLDARSDMVTCSDCYEPDQGGIVIKLGDELYNLTFRAEDPSFSYLFVECTTACEERCLFSEYFQGPGLYKKILLLFLRRVFTASPCWDD
jgi:hypothetical protein